MKQSEHHSGPAPRKAAKDNFVERMFRYWIKHHLTMARHRIGHY